MLIYGRLVRFGCASVCVRACMHACVRAFASVCAFACTCVMAVCIRILYVLLSICVGGYYCQVKYRTMYSNKVETRLEIDRQSSVNKLT